MPSRYPHILRTSDLRAAGLDDSLLRNPARRCELRRIGPGCFLDAHEWSELDARERYEVVVRARLTRMSHKVVASHDSAAALWGLPTLDGWPPTVHVFDPTRSKPLTRNGVARHVGTLAADDICARTDYRLTTPARTILDVSLRDGFVTAVMLFDHGLRHHALDRDNLRLLLFERTRPRRLRAVTRALEAASGQAESPGESISHAQILLLGFEQPELQHSFVENGREVARTDFWWPQAGVVGEFDGSEKYLANAMRQGRSTEQVVLAEKWRSENLLDLHGVSRVVRWDYRHARQPALLAERLRRAGVPRSRPAVSA